MIGKIPYHGVNQCRSDPIGSGLTLNEFVFRQIDTSAGSPWRTFQNLVGLGTDVGPRHIRKYGAARTSQGVQQRLTPKAPRWGMLDENNPVSIISRAHSRRGGLACGVSIPCKGDHRSVGTAPPQFDPILLLFLCENSSENSLF